MNKFLTLLLGCGMAMLGGSQIYAAEAKAVPYSSPIAVSGGFDDGWTVVDVDADGRTWDSNTDQSTTSWGGSGYRARHYASSNSQISDDWLISPAIHLEGGKEYKIFYVWKVESTTRPKNMNVYVSTASEPAQIKTSDPVKAYVGYTNTTYTKENVTFTPSETGDYHVSFQAATENNNYYIFLCGLEVFENTFTPQTVSDLRAERDEDRSIVSVDVTWTLPTQSIFGDNFTPEQTITAVNVYRDGSETPIATLPGTETWFVDNESKGLQPGVHTYQVDVVVAGVRSAKAEATTKYVGPVTPATLPYTWSCGDADSFDDWTVVKGSGSQNTTNWSLYTSYNGARFNSASGKAENDYLISPPFAVTEPGYYKVTIAANPSSLTYSHKLALRYGKNPTEAALQGIVCDDIEFTSSSKGEYSYVVRIDDPATYYFAAVANNPAPTYSYFYYYVYSIGLEKTSKTPNKVTGLTATPDPQENLKVVLDWTCPAMSTNGETLENNEYQIEVYRGDTLLTTLAGGTSTYTDSTVPAPGVYTYSVKTIAPDGPSEGEVSVTTQWVGPHVVALPYETNFNPSDDSVAIWEVIDANNDGKTWHYYENSYRCTQSDINGEVSGTRKYEDYFLSPYFDLTPGYYSVIFTPIGGTAAKPMTHTVGVVKAATFSGNSADLTQVKQFESTTTSSYSYKPVTYLFNITEAGRYQVVFAAIEDQPDASSYSSPDANMYGITNLTVDEYPVLPDLAENVSAIPDQNDSLEAVISWTNPTTTNVEGLGLETITKAVIYRDGEKAGEVTEGLVPGQKASFTDNEEKGLTSGNHKYKVEIFNTAGKSESAAVEVMSEWIGGPRIVAETIPYTWDFSEADNFKNWAIGKGEASENPNYWEYYAATYSTPASATFKMQKEVAEEDYIVAPPFHITEPGYYKVTVAASVTLTSYASKLALHYGTKPRVADLQNVICESIPLDTKSAPYSYEVKIDEPGNYYFAAVAKCPNPGYSISYYVSSLGIEKTEKTPNQVTDLVATPKANEEYGVVLTWTNPSKSTNGEDITPSEYKVEVYKGDDLIATYNDGTSTHTDNDIETAGVYTYTVVTLAPQGATLGGVTVTSKWVGPHVVSIPYATTFEPEDNTVAIWDIVDANNDGNTWYYVKNNTYRVPQPEVRQEDGTYLYDDYFLTPYFELTPGYYSATFKPLGGSYSTFTHHVGLIEAGTFANDSEQLQQVQTYTTSQGYLTSAVKETYVFKIEKEGKYQVVFAAIGSQPRINSSFTSDSYYYGIGDFSAQEYIVLPGIVSDLTVTPAPNEELEAVVSWINPTTSNVAGLAPVLSKAVIYRDGEQIAEVVENLAAGEESSFTDNKETGLTPGTHTYMVEVYTGTYKSEDTAPEVVSGWIGGGLYLPVAYGGNEAVENGDARSFDEWNIVDVKGDYNESTGKYAWVVDSEGISVDNTGLQTADDWIVSPKLSIQKNGTYKVEVKSSVPTGFDPFVPYFYDLYAGIGNDLASYIKVGTIRIAECTSVENGRLDTFYIKGTDVADVIALAAGDDEINPVSVPFGNISLAFHSYEAGKVRVSGVSVDIIDEPGLIPTLTIGETSLEIYPTYVKVSVENDQITVDDIEEDYTIALAYKLNDGQYIAMNEPEGQNNAYNAEIDLELLEPDVYTVTVKATALDSEGMEIVSNEKVVGEFTREPDPVTVELLDATPANAAPGIFDLIIEYTAENVPEEAKIYAMLINDAETDENPYEVSESPSTISVSGFDLDKKYVYTVTLQIEDKDGEVLARSNSKNFEILISGIGGVMIGESVSFNGRTLSFEGVADVRIFNVGGIIVAKYDNAEGSVDLSNLAADTYVITITGNGKTQIFKIVK